MIFTFFGPAPEGSTSAPDLRAPCDRCRGRVSIRAWSTSPVAAASTGRARAALPAADRPPTAPTRVPRPRQALGPDLQPRLLVLLLPGEGGALPGRPVPDVRRRPRHLHPAGDRVPARTGGHDRVAGRRAHADGPRLLPSRGGLRRGVRRRPAAAPHDPDQRHAAHRRVVRVPAREATSSSASASTARSAMHDAYRVDKQARPDVRAGAGRARPPGRRRRRLERALHGARGEPGRAARGVPPLPRRARRPLHPVHPDRRAGRRGRRRAHGPLGRPGGVGRVPRRRSSTSGCGATSARCSCRCSTLRSASWYGTRRRRCASSARRAATPSRSSTTATSTRATTSWIPSTCSATSPRPTWSSCSRHRPSARFGDAKRDTLPRQCRECRVLFACRGECPKNRVATTADGELGLNHLCAGYLHFFTHVDGLMRIMADAHPARGLRRRGHAACSPSARAQRPVPVRQRSQDQAVPRLSRRGSARPQSSRGAGRLRDRRLARGVRRGVSANRHPLLTRATNDRHEGQRRCRIVFP